MRARSNKTYALTHLKTRADRGVKRGELLDGVAKYQVRKHGVDDEDHEEHDGKVDEVRAGEPQRAGDDTQVGLEVHATQHAHDEQQDGDAAQRKVPAGCGMHARRVTCRLRHVRDSGAARDVCLVEHRLAVRSMQHKAAGA